MKELDIKDYQLVTGGGAFFTRTMLNSARTGAVLGEAGYVTEQALLGEPITAKGIIGYSAAGAVGGIATAANAAIRGAGFASEFAGVAVGSSLIGLGNSINNSFNKNSSSIQNKSGSNYADGCDYC